MEELKKGYRLQSRVSGNFKTITDVEKSGGKVVRIELDGKFWLAADKLHNYKLTGEKDLNYGQSKPTESGSGESGTSGAIITGRYRATRRRR